MAKRTAEDVTDGVDLHGKTALITGVNSGIGTETMRVLAARGARVIGTARTLAKAEEACGNCAGETVPMGCELTEPDSIAACVRAIGDEPLSIVVANAGIMALPRLEQVRGIEKQFATNHLGHFQLLTSLLENIRSAEQSRVAIVSSSAHFQAPKAGIDFDNLSGERGYRGFRAYGQSKLANVLFANELARRLPDHVTVNSLHPGVIKTNLGRHMKGPLALGLGLVMFPFMLTVAQGAATSCYVVANPESAELTGCYFADCAVTRANPKATDEALAAKLWEVSETLIRDGGLKA
jgi:WW domain-containing oxidoreductase